MQCCSLYVDVVNSLASIKKLLLDDGDVVVGG
jgi:hypothetical protein